MGVYQQLVKSVKQYGLHRSRSGEARKWGNRGRTTIINNNTLNTTIKGTQA